MTFMKLSVIIRSESPPNILATYMPKLGPFETLVMLFPLMNTSDSTPWNAYAVPAASFPPLVDMLKLLFENVTFLLYPKLIPYK